MACRASERSCVLCCQELDVFAVGKCDHPICFRCSTKMRVLCEQRYCAVCREELDKVVFVKRLSAFSTIPSHQLQYEKKYGIYFADGKVFSLYRRLLQHECSLCPEVRPFHSFLDLEQHMRKQHELFCCKLCVKHLKNFTYERKWYSRKDLARHRIHGDSDDTSHRGHPLCKFCDERYLDNDELLKHLRRDHYFCHFCDSDGAQEYYSDYDYLREHFRETHFLCEEGRCAAEQFTHAFRTEIDYKAHKTSFHSKNRAEARQNRQIDLQFSYTPRHLRRNEGVVSREDFEEVDRYNRQGRAGRGGSRGGQNRRGSWRYKREEEDREIAAAVRASVAARRQEERKQVNSKEDGNKSRRDDGREPEEMSSFKKMSRPSQETAAAKEVVKPVDDAGTPSQEDIPAFGSTVAGAVPSSVESVSAKLKDEDFPSLCTAVSSAVPTVSTGLSLSYSSARKSSAFQEEDFPALVSKHKPNKAVSTIMSAWANGSSKNMVKTNSPNGIRSNLLLKKSSSAGSKVSHKSNKAPVSQEEDDEEGKSTLEVRSAPTMFDISSLLTASSVQTLAKIGKKKRMGAEKKSCSSSPLAAEQAASSSHKENVAEAERTPTPPAVSILSDKSNTVANGHVEKKATTTTSKCKEPPGLKKPVVAYQCPLPDEDFPALENHTVSRMPPPGFTSVAKPCHPPPGLSAVLNTPPPGFTTIPPKSISSDSLLIPAKEPSPSTGSYLVPENFQQRNIHLIQSIKDFLQSDESRFNEFKTYSGKFRQGLISAAEYYRNCRDLLGENFKKIFNELLVLLPDTAKQQELLFAHNDFRIEEKQSFNRSKKTKNVWQTNSTPSELDFSICPTCKQVVAQKDAAAHKTLHVEDDEFPSLQAIRKIIS